MNRAARTMLTLLTVGMAMAVGCLYSSPYHDGGTGGQGGSGGPGGSGGEAGAPPQCTEATVATDCTDDDNVCTETKCIMGKCFNEKLTIPSLPESTECHVVSCNDGSRETNNPPHCGFEGKLDCVDGACKGCMSVGDCGVAQECEEVLCDANQVCQHPPSSVGTAPKNVPDTKHDCKKPVCDGNKAVATVDDDSDVPLDDGNPCTDEQCAMQLPLHPPLASGAPCVVAVSPKLKACDGDGACVECTQNMHCMSGTTPRCDLPAHICVSCSDGMQNGGETGVDCGGPCKKCDGVACGGSGECKNNACEDGVCCDKSCGGDCAVCALPGHVGVCTNIPAGVENGSCSGGSKACSGAGMCSNPIGGLKAGELCVMSSQCATGACSAGICRLPLGAPCVEDAECTTLLCTANSCAPCLMDSVCGSNKCDLGTGHCLAAGGSICGQHSDCAGGNCDATAHLCGKANNASCGAPTDCLSGYCTGTKCAGCDVNMQDAQCLSKKCDGVSHYCLLPLDAACYNDQDCASPHHCGGFPPKCHP